MFSRLLSGSARASSRVMSAARPASARAVAVRGLSSTDSPLRALLGDLADRVPRSAPASRVFCNRELRFDRVKAIGFDYDYTLASYRDNLNVLIYESAKRYLVERQHYPEIETTYDRDFAIRGLIFDKRHGALLKLSYSRAVSPGTAFIGRRRLSEPELRELYGDALHLAPEDIDEHTNQYNDLFSLSETCLLTDIVQLAVDRGIPFDPGALAADVAQAVSWVHLSGKLHDAVAAAPQDYLHPIEDFASLLDDARASGKKLFILTNSPFAFMATGMRFLLGDSWRDKFDLVVASAKKPSFFRSEGPFRAVSKTKGYLRWQRAGPTDVSKGRVLVGGSLAELTRLTGWSGRDVLYVGDHLHADLREPRRQGWATAAIIRELDEELDVMATDEYQALRARSVEIDDLLARVQRLEGAGVTEALDALEAERERVRGAMKFNANFGSVFRNNADSTAYAFAVKQHVDIYTSRLEHLLKSTDARFYPTRTRLLPHDPQSW